MNESNQNPTIFPKELEEDISGIDDLSDWDVEIKKDEDNN